MLDRKLIDYLPPVLQSVMEFAAITGAQQPEIEAAWDALNLVMDNQFIDTATEAGVTVWEKEIGIIPLATDTLDERKTRLMVQWNSNTNYTLSFFIQLLRLLDNDVSIVQQDYCLLITISFKDYTLHDLKNMFSMYLPANIIVLCKIKYPQKKFSRYTHSQLQHFTHGQLKNGIPIEEAK